MFFFFNDTAPTEIYSLALHDALPICVGGVKRLRPNVEEVTADVSLPIGLGGAIELNGTRRVVGIGGPNLFNAPFLRPPVALDRKSTRLNSSHANISHAGFCLKKKMHD